MYYKLKSSYEMLGAMGEISLILLRVKMYLPSQNAVACFKANPILEKVWTRSKWDIFVLVSSIHINQHSLLGHSMFCYGVCKDYTLIIRTLFCGK